MGPVDIYHVSIINTLVINFIIAVQYITTSRIQELNLGPLVYKTSALTPELIRQKKQYDIDRI